MSAGATVDAGGVEITGNGTGDSCLLAMLDGSEGTGVWGKTENGTGDIGCTSLAIGEGGELFAALEMHGSAEIGDKVHLTVGGMDGLLVAYGSVGPAAPEAIWSRSFGGTDADVVTDIVATPQGDVTATMHFHATIDLGGGVSPDIDTLQHGGAAISQYDGQTGEYRWSSVFDGDDGQEFMHLAAGSDGSIISSGWAVGTVEFGTWQLESPPGPTDANDDANCVVARYGPNGELGWAYSYGSALGSEDCAGAAVYGDGRVAVAGGFGHPMVVGDQTYAPDGRFDTFVLELAE
jgi:hypothetical protein